MFLERRTLPKSGKVEIWECEWENPVEGQARKRFVRKIGDEQPIMSHRSAASVQHAICWSYGRTLANIAVVSPTMTGHFPESAGSDARLPCEFVSAGKFRHGAPRWWCRTHQTHWGTKADQRTYADSKQMTCANHTQAMSYVVAPFELNLDDHAEVFIGCSLPPAISSSLQSRRPPMISVGTSDGSGGTEMDEHEAISLVYQPRLGLFDAMGIQRLNITPPAALEFVLALEADRAMDCIACSHCQFPHLDLGDFARKPHRKHFCANCGRDSTWSKEPIISTPLKPLYDEVSQNKDFVVSARSIDLADYPGYEYTVTASTPAVLWKSTRPQEVGMRVRLWRGEEDPIEDTFGSVLIDGRELDRSTLLHETLDRTIF